MLKSKSEDCSLRTELDHLTEYLETQSRDVHKLARKVSRRLDPKSIHQLRVAIRRTRTVFWILQQSSDDIHCKKLGRQLRRLGRSLGNVRELNVAISDAARFGIDSSCLIGPCKIAKAKLRKLCNRNQRNKLMRRLSELEKSARALNPELLSKAHDRLQAKLNRQLKLRIRGQASLHQLRIIMKRARYSLESMGSSIEPMKPLQDVIGGAHDLEILQELIGKHPEIKMEQYLLNKKAIGLIKPALNFAIAQLAQKKPPNQLTKAKLHRRDE